MSADALPLVALYRVEHIRATEAKFARANPGVSLMQRAGEACARRACAYLDQARIKPALILAGPGNNGGDAWVVAHALLQAKIPVSVIAFGDQAKGETTAQKARAAYLQNGGKIIAPIGPKPNQDAAFDGFGLIVDGLFGSGFATRPINAEIGAVMRAANAARLRHGTHILAIDIASGLDANTGTATADAIIADETVTMVGAKPGLFTADGIDHSGRVIIETLGVKLEASHACLLNWDAMRTLIPHRRANSHKGDYGTVGIIGGAAGMVGAAILAARTTLHMGAGKVMLAVTGAPTFEVDPTHPEIMIRRASVLLTDESVSSYAIGMGLGTTATAATLLKQTLALRKPTVIDADALTLIASKHSIGAAFGKHDELPFVLTPHPGEAARLLQTTTASIQADRISAACTLARKFSSVVVLKGAGTIVAHPDGRLAINTTGNPGMASGGMGDALAGMIAALLAQGLSTWDAACVGVCLHGAAADAAVGAGMGPIGLTASDILCVTRSLINA